MKTNIPLGMLPERVKAETDLRLKRAMALIQRAQYDLNAVCSELSALDGAHPTQQACGKLSDKVRALWYRVDELKKAGRCQLDSTNIAAILRRDAAEVHES